MSSSKNDFQRRPATLTRYASLKEGQQVVIVTQAYGPDGESLMDESEHRFSGERGIRVRVRQGELEADVILSPFFGDPSKKCEATFVTGQRCELYSPATGRALDRLPEMQTDEGGHYYAIYLSNKLQNGELVAINDIWNNPHSRLMSEGDMLMMLIEHEQSEQSDL